MHIVFQGLSLLALLAYPAAVYVIWENVLVDHELSPFVAFLPAVPMAVVFHAVGSVFRKVISGPVLRAHKPNADGNLATQQNKVLVLAWKVVEVCILSLVGWSVVRNEAYFPASLGGQGNAAIMFPNGRRFVPQHEALYCATRVAYLFEWWFFHDGLKQAFFTNPLVSMHHVATSVLLCCAVFSGMSQFGSIIIFVHDAANCPVQILLWLQKVHCPSALIIATYLFSLYMWAHFLLYAFPVEVLLPSLTEEHAQRPEWIVWWCMFFVLMVHHVYVYVKLLAYIPALASPSAAVESARSKDH